MATKGRPVSERIKTLYNTMDEIDEKKGSLSPRELVNKARSKSSPIHDCFTWDDKKAGENFRVWQARKYIDSYKIVVQGQRVRAYHNIKVQFEDVKTQGYYGIEKVLSDKQLHDALLKEMASEITRLYDKYKTLKEIKTVINKDAVEDIMAAVA